MEFAALSADGFEEIRMRYIVERRKRVGDVTEVGKISRSVKNCSVVNGGFGC